MHVCGVRVANQSQACFPPVLFSTPLPHPTHTSPFSDSPVFCHPPQSGIFVSLSLTFLASIFLKMVGPSQSACPLLGVGITLPREYTQVVHFCARISQRLCLFQPMGGIRLLCVLLLMVHFNHFCQTSPLCFSLSVVNILWGDILRLCKIYPSSPFYPLILASVDVSCLMLFL